MRYLAILAVWLICYFAPMYAGDWYDQNFPQWQSAISLFLLVFVLNVSRDWWRKEYACVCVLQILHNMSDAFLDFPAEHYNDITAILNLIEISILLGFGGGTELYRMIYGRHNRSHTGSGPDTPQQRVHERNGDCA